MKSAIFDLDGTIVRSEGTHFKTFNEIFGRFGINLSLDEWKNIHGLGSRKIFEKVFDENGVKGQDIDNLILEREKLFVDAVERDGLHAVNGFIGFYNSLKRKKVKVIIATSGHRINVEEELKSLGLDEQEFVCADDINELKPSPEIFLEAAKRLDERPEECVVFEDSEPGVIAAKNAGMYVVGVLATSDMKQLQKADKIVEDFRDDSLRYLFDF